MLGGYYRAPMRLSSTSPRHRGGIGSRATALASEGGLTELFLGCGAVLLGSTVTLLGWGQPFLPFIGLAIGAFFLRREFQIIRGFTATVAPGSAGAPVRLGQTARFRIFRKRSAISRKKPVLRE